MTHRVVSRTREILPADLPKVRVIQHNADESITEIERAAAEAELLNFGIIPTGAPNVYDCREQENDFETPGVMKPVVALPGRVLTEGPVSKRFAELPPDKRDLVLQAEVYRASEEGIVRATTPDEPAPRRAREPLEPLRERLDREMERDGVPLEDRERVILERAREQAADPNAPVARVRVAMADIDPDDVIEAENLPPSRWSGESET